MALSRVPENLPAYNPNKSTLAFGNRALPKIRRELCDSDIEVIQQALLLLDDLLRKPENITSAVREGLIKSLSLLLAHNDSVVKYRAAHCLTLAAEHSLGRQAFLRLNIISALAKLFADPDATVRLNAHWAVEMCARTKQGVQGVLDTNLVPILVDRFLKEEELDLKLPILDTLHWCLMADPSPGLECRSIERLQSSLSDTSAEIRWRVARCIYALTVPHSGKHTCCECQLVKDLIPLLTDGYPLVRTHVAAVTMSISVITEGKYAVLKEGGLKKLVTLLPDRTPAVRLNAIKSLTLLAETPKGKEELKASLNKVEALKDDPDPVISKAAKTAYNVITWTP